MVEADLPRLRGVLGDIKLSIADLDNQHIGLKEELLYLKKTHEEVTPPFHYLFHQSIATFILNHFPQCFSPLHFYRICTCCEQSKALLTWRLTARLIQTSTGHWMNWEFSTRPLLRKIAGRLNNGTRARLASRTK